MSRGKKARERERDAHIHTHTHAYTRIHTYTCVHTIWFVEVTQQSHICFANLVGLNLIVVVIVIIIIACRAATQRVKRLHDNVLQTHHLQPFPTARTIMDRRHPNKKQP